ncbi:MAG: DUF58 domain-containing protein [Ahrensia sp.]|nr:DUF58 domain-containing protein [Ahrensia sp.]
MAPIGQATAATSNKDALQRARQRAALVPELLVEAQRIANTVVAGWHGRKKRGIGETFWQYRPYAVGETMARIDWRRSARDDQTYVRDQEWEAAHTIWLWVDKSPSMLFKSSAATVSKESRALVITFALAELFSRAGERIGYPSLLKPAASRNGAQRLATAFANSTSETANEPSLTMVQRHSDIVIISDFLVEPDTTIAMIDQIGAQGARMHLVEVADPAEEEFPYDGRVEFLDPETGIKLTSGRAQDWREQYRNLYHARRDVLRARCRAHGGSYTVSRTDRLASETLVQLHGYFTGNPVATAPQGGGV